jgi:hypothetical protein
MYWRGATAICTERGPKEELNAGMPEELDEQELERLRMVRLTAPR